MTTSDTLLWKTGLYEVHGLPVYYCNGAIRGSTGKGIIVPPPEPITDPEDRFLVRWKGELTVAPDPTMQAFTTLVGPELGQAGGHHTRVTCPWCLEIDLSDEVGRKALESWCSQNGAAGIPITDDGLIAVAWTIVSYLEKVTYLSKKAEYFEDRALFFLDNHYHGSDRDKYYAELDDWGIDD